jgi:hypothetical protein
MIIPIMTVALTKKSDAPALRGAAAETPDRLGRDVVVVAMD